MASSGKGSGRGRQPKDPASESSVSNEGKTSKRRCIPTACIPCRKRKSKCDGTTPKCSTCTAVYKTECSYDAEALEAGRRSKASSKRDNTVLAEEKSAAEILIAQLRGASETEAAELLYQIRNSDGDVQSIAESVRRAGKIPPKTNASVTEGLEGEYSHIHTKTNNSGQTFQYGLTSNLGFISTEDDFNPGRKMSMQIGVSNPITWTEVSNDVSFIHHLLRLYFTWSNSFYDIVIEEDFYRDMESGEIGSCSSLLINSMCSLGAQYTDMPAARKDLQDPSTAGEHFLEAAKLQLFKDETSCLTTVQALAILGLREVSTGRDSMGFAYAGRCMRMAVELGLHLGGSFSQAPLDSQTTGRNRIFWGLYTCDTVWSLCIGRVGQLPRAAIDIEKPKNIDTVDAWYCHTDAAMSRNDLPAFYCNRNQFLLRFSNLSDIVNDMITMFYAPQERMNSRKVLDKFRRFQSWYQDLPESLRLNERAPPHVFTLHLYYNTLILHLFRPIIRFDLVNSPVNPSERCKSAAIEISRIVMEYQKLYGLRNVNLMMNYALLSAATVHLFDVPYKITSPNDYTTANITALRYVLQTLEEMKLVAQNHVYATRSTKIIEGLAERNGRTLSNFPLQTNLAIRPGDAAQSPRDRPAAIIRTTSMNAPSINAVDRIRQRSNTSELSNNHTQFNSRSSTNSPAFVSTPSSTSSRTKSKYRPLATSMPTPISYTAPPASHVIPAETSLPGLTSHPQMSSTSEVMDIKTEPIPKAPDIFWTPFEGQLIPLYGQGQNFDTSPMDLSNMLGQVDLFEQFSRDGFKVSDHSVWNSGPLLGITGNEGSEQQVIQSPEIIGGGQHQQQPQHADIGQPGLPPHQGHGTTGSAPDGYSQEWWHHTR